MPWWGIEMHDLETERLLLQPMRPDHADRLHSIWVDPVARRFLWDDRVISPDDVETVILASMSDFDAHKIGMYVIRLRAEPEPVVGFAGMRFSRAGAPELLFGLDTGHLGQGYAHEAVSAILEYAFSQVGFEEVESDINRANDEAKRLIRRLGGALVEFAAAGPQATHPGSEPIESMVVFRISRKGFNEAARRARDRLEERDDVLVGSALRDRDHAILDPFREGEYVGRYQVVELIFRGPVAAYYLARDRCSERTG